MRRPTFVVASIALLVAALPAAAQNTDPKQQQQSASRSVTDTKSAGQKSGTTQNSTKDSPPAQRFPYPGESEPADKLSGDSLRAPDSASSASPSAAGKRFPYPGDPDVADSSASSSSSSSSSAVSPEKEDLSGDAETPVRRKLPREFHPQSSEDRGTEDLDVARFYRDKGDIRAAYLRARDAVTTLPNDPEGHFLLAQIAQQMKHREEAVAEFNNYLRLEPDGEHVREARRRLAEMH